MAIDCLPLCAFLEYLSYAIFTSDLLGNFELLIHARGDAPTTFDLSKHRHHDQLGIQSLLPEP